MRVKRDFIIRLIKRKDTNNLVFKVLYFELFILYNFRDGKLSIYPSTTFEHPIYYQKFRLHNNTSNNTLKQVILKFQYFTIFLRFTK